MCQNGFAIDELESIQRMSDCYDREMMDTILTRNEFVDDELIMDFLDCASQEAWNWVYENRAKYSENIRMLIEPHDFRFPVDKLMIRVVDLTDKDWSKLELEREKAIEETFEKDWVKYASTLQDRALTTVDSELDDAWEKFCTAKETYTKHIERPASKKYVAPSSRGTTDARVDELKEDIVVAENEYDLAQKAVEDADEFYWATQRSQYRKTWVPSV